MTRHVLPHGRDGAAAGAHPAHRAGRPSHPRERLGAAFTRLKECVLQEFVGPAAAAPVLAQRPLTV